MHSGMCQLYDAIRALLHCFFEVTHKSYVVICISVSTEISARPPLQKRFLGVEAKNHVTVSALATIC